MKKNLGKLFAVICLVVMACGAVFTQTADAAKYIGETRAKQIAYKHAGATEAGARLIKLKLDHEFGGAEYEVDFIYKGAKYEYDIDASTGAVKKYEKKMGRGGAVDSKYIDSQKAENIALKHAGLSRKDVSRLRTELDHDDGMVKYEVKFYSNGNKYEYEIDAKSGNILKFDHND